MSAAPSAGPLRFVPANSDGEIEPFGLSGVIGRSDATPLPAASAYFLHFFQEMKVMKKMQKIVRAAQRWQVLARVRWQQLLCPVAALY